MPGVSTERHRRWTMGAWDGGGWVVDGVPACLAVEYRSGILLMTLSALGGFPAWWTYVSDSKHQTKGQSTDMTFRLLPLVCEYHNQYAPSLTAQCGMIGSHRSR